MSCWFAGVTDDEGSEESESEEEIVDENGVTRRVKKQRKGKGGSNMVLFSEWKTMLVLTVLHSSLEGFFENNQL